MAEIKRFDTNQRMSQAVAYGDTVYLAGQVAAGDSVTAQTEAVLAQIDGLLARAGSDKNHLIKAYFYMRRCTVIHFALQRNELHSKQSNQKESGRLLSE